jgi:hypothetical protein
MRRAPSLLLKASLLAAGWVVAGGAGAAGTGAASDAAKRPNNSFNLYVAPPGAGTVALPSPGVGIASSKGVIMDPYKVPLIQNAGSMTPGR